MRSFPNRTGSMRLGSGASSETPPPSAPQAPEPQARTSPDATTATTALDAQATETAATPAVSVAATPTRFGTSASSPRDARPCPSWPRSFPPQVYTRPLAGPPPSACRRRRRTKRPPRRPKGPPRRARASRARRAMPETELPRVVGAERVDVSRAGEREDVPPPPHATRLKRSSRVPGTRRGTGEVSETSLCRFARAAMRFANRRKRIERVVLALVLPRSRPAPTARRWSPGFRPRTRRRRRP